MTDKYKFKVYLTTEGETYTEARNKILRVGAKAELEGKILHFELGTGWKLEE